ncbi:uncharacterized protein [Miscanthus floridulus]|uniref:uncharacterized protein n=1 Tax=Miscanthus floridulus TaxID=154761 RepID=UPI00345A37BF
MGGPWWAHGSGGGTWEAAAAVSGRPPTGARQRGGGGGVWAPFGVRGRPSAGTAAARQHVGGPPAYASTTRADLAGAQQRGGARETAPAADNGVRVMAPDGCAAACGSGGARACARAARGSSLQAVAEVRQVETAGTRQHDIFF